MSEYRTTEIQTMLKSERKGVRNSDSSDFRHSGFWNYVHLNCLKSKLKTPTIIQHLNAIINALQVDMGIGIKKIAFRVDLCFVIIPFYISVWNPNSKFRLYFLEFGFQTEKSVWNPNCLETERNWTVWNPN